MGLESLIKANITSDNMSKHLESGTEINYDRMLIPLITSIVKPSSSLAYDHDRLKSKTEGL